jgi:amino acid transporter
LLPKILALPVFSSDPLSSVAYATEEMMLVLALAGTAAIAYKMPLAIAVAALLLIVVTSYRQTVRAYPRGGGSYIVAHENLGIVPGLVAAAAILTDYVLTVAVSITAGTIAITSAVPGLGDLRVEIAIVLVAFVTLANLRGVKEAGILFAVPTYGFVAVVALTIVTGLVRCIGGCPLADTSDLEIHAETTITLFLLLRAFSSGATALTGVEAIADGVQAFRRPQAKNAATTLLVMGIMASTLFLGITFLAQALHVRITEEIAATNSVLSQIGRTVFGGGFLFYVLQVFTAGILVLAANTAFQDFPRLSSILARDRYMPSQFRNRGDRLVFSNGVLILAGLASILIWIYEAELTRLIQLYVVGVFTAFTLSQAGMVRRWFRVKGQGWRHRAVINGIGAFTTGVVLVIVTITKFSKGAKVVVYTIPFIVLFFLAVHHHYGRVSALLRQGRISAHAVVRNTFVVLVERVDQATLGAVAYLRAVRPEHVVAFYTGAPGDFESTAATWSQVAPRLGDLVRAPDAERHPVRAVRRWIRDERETSDEFFTVVIAEQVEERGLLRQSLRKRAAFALKAALLFEPGVVVTDVPFVAGEATHVETERVLEPTRHVVLIPIAGVHDATVRAVSYAKSLQPAFIQALYMETDPEQGEGIVGDWHARELDVPLVLVEAAFRELNQPLLDEIRRHTQHRDTVVTVVLPEVIPRHWWENALHNQTALFVKRLLLRERQVVLTSVPFHLRHAEVALATEDPPA